MKTFKVFGPIRFYNKIVKIYEGEEFTTNHKDVNTFKKSFRHIVRKDLNVAKEYVGNLSVKDMRFDDMTITICNYCGRIIDTSKETHFEGELESIICVECSKHLKKFDHYGETLYYLNDEIFILIKK